MSYSLLSKYRTELMGIAMLWVMLFHAKDVVLLRPFEYLRDAGFGGVDIFILLSAMGLSLSLSKKERSYTEFMGRRALRVLPSYYLVMVPYDIVKIALGIIPLSALIWNSSLLYYWVHSIGAFNWYITAIMTFYAITPFCVEKLKKSPHRELSVFIGSIVGIFIYMVLVHDGYWNHVDFFYRVPVFLLGLLLGLYIYEGRRFSLKDGASWLMCVLLGAVYVLLYMKRTVFMPLCLLFLLWTVPGCLAVSWLFDKLPLGLLRRFLRTVGQSSLEIYLLNVSLFSETEFLRRFLDFDAGHYVYTLITVAANIALGVLLHKAVVKLLRRVKNRHDTTCE